MKKFILNIISGLLSLTILNKIFEKVGFERRKDFEFFLHHIRSFYIYSGTTPSIIYIGAHNGSAAIKINEIVNYESIYLFEPNSDLVAIMISKNIPNATIINQAVDDRDEDSVIFNVSEKSSISSLKDLNTNSSWYQKRKSQFNKMKTEFIEKRRIKVTRLSTFINKNDIKHGEVLVIDTQGNSLDVLRSCEEQLKKSFFHFIFVEIIFDNCYSSKEKIMDIESYLDQFGYETIGQHSQSSLFEDCGQVDMLYGSTDVISTIENQKLDRLHTN